MCTGGTANSAAMSGSLHIYAEPDELVADGRTTRADDEPYHDQHHQLDPAHISIDVVLQRGIESRRKPSRCYVSDESWTTRNVYWPRTSVCLSVCVSVRRRMPTLLHGPGCNLVEW